MDKHVEKLLRQRASEIDKDTVTNTLAAFVHAIAGRIDPESEEFHMMFESLGKDGRELLALCMLAAVLGRGRR